MQVRSPIAYVGGKAASVSTILQHLPQRKTYQVYVEPFAGALNVILNLPPARLECINDLNGNLINFWLQCRDHASELQKRADSLPYARSLYNAYRASLLSNEPLDDMERAVRWFYVQRSGIGGKGFDGWGYRTRFDWSATPSCAHSYHNAIDLLKAATKRLRDTQIEQQDFSAIIRLYESENALIYCDPPYVDAESYYNDIPPFTEADHRRLADLLNATPAMVALSYYPHPLVDELYPASKWRRVTWQVYKSVEKTTETRQKAQELLLLNYPAHIVTQSLWTPESVLEASDTVTLSA